MNSWCACIHVVKLYGSYFVLIMYMQVGTLGTKTCEASVSVNMVINYW